MIALDLFGKRFHAMFVCVSIPHFVVWIIWPKLKIYSQGVSFVDKFENIIHDVRVYVDFNWTSFTNFVRFWCFSDFVKIALLCQNSTYIETLKSFVIGTGSCTSGFKALYIFSFFFSSFLICNKWISIFTQIFSQK